MSATFFDGPAKGRELNLRRLPTFLRVVEDDGNVDALDLPDDNPNPWEKIYAYRMIDGTGISGFMCGSSHHKGCLYFNSAMYRMCAMQPEESILRNGKSWREWVEEYSKEVEA